MSAYEAKRRTLQVWAVLECHGLDGHVRRLWTRTNRDYRPTPPSGGIRRYRTLIVLDTPDAVAAIRDALGGEDGIERTSVLHRDDQVARYDGVAAFWRWEAAS